MQSTNLRTGRQSCTETYSWKDMCCMILLQMTDISHFIQSRWIHFTQLKKSNPEARKVLYYLSLLTRLHSLPLKRIHKAWPEFSEQRALTCLHLNFVVHPLKLSPSLQDRPGRTKNKNKLATAWMIVVDAYWMHLRTHESGYHLCNLKPSR